MSGRYILSVDQSTQGTKALIFDRDGALLARADLPHRQIVNAQGWVEHDPEEILQNTLRVVRLAAEKANIDKNEIAAMGISNQRETVAVWNRKTGKPLANAVVWQCARAAALCKTLAGSAALVREKTGLALSPYFSAPKLAWLLQNVPAVAAAAQNGTLCCGTMDSWLIFHLTEERAFKTEYSNASRTQLYNIHKLTWDAELCRLYGVPPESLAEVCMSDSVFGTTTLGGWLGKAIPICGVLGDSHAALLGQNCREPGSIKATYGTGSSVMMQTGTRAIHSSGGLVTSLAWGLGGQVHYVLEGNLNYTGAVITWLHKNVALIAADSESEALARAADPGDKTYFVPAFTGLGAPYWDSEATALLTGMTRTTGRAEIVKACLECIGYQIADLLGCMARDSGLAARELRVDGGPTANAYLMQFQSDIAGVTVAVPNLQELSGIGAAYAAGCACGLYDPAAGYTGLQRKHYTPAMPEPRRQTLYKGWQQAVRQALTHG
ncbi:MAG: glycerol kinase GlpK [Gemmiger sp.]|nr:glycerol kinase GlpK [Gemmiger sp.]